MVEKIVYILENEYNLPLTYMKIYDVVKIRKYSRGGGFVLYDIKDDNGDISAYDSSRFIPLDEWRERQINKILDDEL